MSRRSDIIDNRPVHHRLFNPVVARWFDSAFDVPTDAQEQAWPVIADGGNALLLAPTGSGKTLAAFLAAIDRIMFHRPAEDARHGVRVLYLSPLKALGVDVERNLQSPIAGVRALAGLEATDHRLPRVAVRSGDTSTADRARIVREPPDILITTPESLFLMLTSKAREVLATVETVIIDEIHVMVPSKRGAHLFLSLERLEQLRQRVDPQAAPLQRIGLSATQRPLDEVARLLGGLHGDPATPRPVEILEAGGAGPLELLIEVPVEDMARLGDEPAIDGPAAAGPSTPSIWPSIHPRLVALIRDHRSTMIFVNSRRLAERLASAINELADEELAAAHHGSIAKDARIAIEDRLKQGVLPAIVATSSLELGVDMGAVDLVIQIESPPTIASGLQRIGRAGHQVGAPSKGVLFPKYRADLLAASAAAGRMLARRVEETRYPRNPLDVLAQQLVAMVALEPAGVDDLYATVTRAAPFAELPRASFEGVLDMLAGRYPSQEFAGLKARVNWDRIDGIVSPRRGTQRVAILNAGTIPDRGLYGVFIEREDGTGNRVGELDEEMVFETRPGDVFLLGASSWRVLDIDHDRVTVAPAPGEPGRMPFWRGDGPGRPLEFGRAVGELTRRLLGMERGTAETLLRDDHRLDERAAKNLLDYLTSQKDHAGVVPDDKTVVVECFMDEVGDWRVAVLTPFGARVHAPWAMAVAGRLRADDADVDMMWTDDGIVFRLPESDRAPDTQLFLPSAQDVEDRVVNELGGSALFAARFRENSARALLLPRRQPGKRTPLWMQRRRSADLLAVASRFPDFPILLETYREVLRDVFDLKGLRDVLIAIEQRRIRVRRTETDFASPFAASLMFSYVGNFIYNGDAPLAERRAATLALDHNQLRELLGDAELRELLDADAVDELALSLQHLDKPAYVKDADGVHDLLQSLGDLDRDELGRRIDPALHDELDGWLEQLETHRRIVRVRIAATQRYIAAEDAARYRDALGVALPVGLPDAFLEPMPEPMADLVLRYARTHVPFGASEPAARFGLGIAAIDALLAGLTRDGRLLEGEFLPGARGREWCDPNVLRILKRRSLARLRKEIEPVEAEALARFLPNWHGIDRPRHGLDGLLDVVEQIEGYPIPASDLERHVLPARVAGYRPGDLDELCAAGEVVWRGIEGTGPGDGRIAVYLTDHYPLLAPEPEVPDLPMCTTIVELLDERGALFFDDIVHHVGGFRNDVFDALWDLVWSGVVTNDTLSPLRTLGTRSKSRRRGPQRGRFRSRRVAGTPGSEGRWSLLARAATAKPADTERLAARVARLVERHGILTRESVSNEAITGGFSSLYPVLKAMEEAGRLRRGYFVAGLGAAQFAAPGADERLREPPPPDGKPLVLAANDPANVWGAALKWPERPEGLARPGRVAGSRVVLHDGRLIGYLGRTGRSLQTFLPDTDPERSAALTALGDALGTLAIEGAPVFLEKIDGRESADSPLAPAFAALGFSLGSRGLLLKRDSALARRDRQRS